jgi:hypothetical protein
MGAIMTTSFDPRRDEWTQADSQRRIVLETLRNTTYAYNRANQAVHAYIIETPLSAFKMIELEPLKKEREVCAIRLAQAADDLTKYFDREAFYATH